MDRKKVALRALVATYAVTAVLISYIFIRLAHLDLDDSLVFAGVIGVWTLIVIARTLHGWGPRRKLSLAWRIVVYVVIPVGVVIVGQFDLSKTARLVEFLVLITFYIWLFLLRSWPRRGGSLPKDSSS